MADVQFLETQSKLSPYTAEHFAVLSQLYEKKLWHQLTAKLEEIVRTPAFLQDGMLVQLHKNFIFHIESKLNALRLAHILVAVSSRLPTRNDSLTFLSDAVTRFEAETEGGSRVVKEAVILRMKEPILYIRMHSALLKLQGGEVTTCKEMLEEGKAVLDSLTDVDPSVNACVHHVSSMLHKVKQNFAEFYKSGMLYLAYISVDSLDEVTKMALAVDLSLAALLGEDIYNFGELLSHPVINSLTSPNSSYGWLHAVLVAFNAGDLDQYDTLCSKYSDALNAQPALVQHERRLREKITILCLMEIIFNEPSDNRVISLAHIAQKTKLSMDGVEFLLMKTLSVHLIEGVIDQVNGTVNVSWVQPRVLGLPQIQELRNRMDTWLDKVHSTLLSVENETPELLGMV